MIFSDEKLSELRESVRARLSERRFGHTVSVEAAAEKIAGFCLPEAVSELRAAAILHDLTKELDDAEQLAIIKSIGIMLDKTAPPVYHSITAPTVISRDFPDFATENILSSAYNHTTAAPDMSLFDEIIFVADYVEDGRTYPSCVAVRDTLYSAFAKARDREECIAHLHNATVSALDNTVLEVVRTGKYLDLRTVEARNAFLGRRPMPLK